MAQNYISRGEVITLTAGATYISGMPYRISGFNGVALISVSEGEQLSFQLTGIFEFVLADVKVGDLIDIDIENNLSSRTAKPTNDHDCIFGRAATSTDSNGKFLCRLLQS